MFKLYVHVILNKKTSIFFNVRLFFRGSGRFLHCLQLDIETYYYFLFLLSMYIYFGITSMMIFFIMIFDIVIFFRNNVNFVSQFDRRGRFKFAELVLDPSVYTILTIKYVQTKPYNCTQTKFKNDDAVLQNQDPHMSQKRG